MTPIEEYIIKETTTTDKITQKPKKHVTFFQYNFINLTENDLELFNPNLKIFEIKMQQVYPLGSDFYIIDHGNNYFAFFRRLGDVNCIIIQHNDIKIIIGTACAILRKYSLKTPDKSTQKKNEIYFWYLCDLKIDEKHRGQNLTFKLFTHMIHKFMGISNRAYLISMDSNSKQIIHIFDGLVKHLPLKITYTKLLIYSVSLQIMKEIERYFVCAYKDISYLSLAGTKDLILSSTNKTLELYHLQHSTFASKNNTQKLNELPENATIMFCFPKNSPFEIIFDTINLKTDISATIISWGMNFFDWHEVLTSDI
jgi:hypothetical protein